MHDSGFMGARQGAGDLDGVAECGLWRQAFAPDELIERLSLEVLHDDEAHAFGAVHIVDGDDARVIEGRGGPGFLREAALALRIGDPIGGQNFNGDVAIEAGVAGLVDRTHAAFAELLDDLKVRQFVPDQSHEVLRSNRPLTLV